MSRTSRNHFGLAALLAALSTLGPFSIDTFLPAMRAIGDTLSASPLEMQQALTVYLFCYALMMLWHGSIPTRWAAGRWCWRPRCCSAWLRSAARCQYLGPAIVVPRAAGLCGGAGLVVGRAIIRDRLEGAAAGG